MNGLMRTMSPMTTTTGGDKRIVLQTYQGLGDNIYQRGHLRDWKIRTGARRIFSPWSSVHNQDMNVTNYRPMESETVHLFPSYDGFDDLTFTEVFEKRGRFNPEDFFFPEAGTRERNFVVARPPAKRDSNDNPKKRPSEFLWRTVVHGPFRDEFGSDITWLHRDPLDEKVLYPECRRPSIRGSAGSLGVLMSGVKVLLTTECFALPLALAARVPEIWFVAGKEGTCPDRLIDPRLVSTGQRIFLWEERDGACVSRRMA